MTEPAERPSRKKVWALYALPTLLLFLWVVFPLMRGTDTLYQRDVLNTHLPMKHAQAEAMRGGSLPLLDPYRALGQPLAGNPNAVPFYPDNLLYLVTPTLWALNAHFWLHLLLAVPAMAFFARAWGLGRRAAWVAGVAYATSGFFLSHLSFYNLIAAAVLAPLFGGACLKVAAGGNRSRWVAASALLWALLVVAGEPMMALLAGLVGLSAAWVGRDDGPRAESFGSKGRQVLWLGLAVALGTLVAAPQVVEFLRILPSSFRGAIGYSAASSTVASWDPRQIVEWLLPFPFGRHTLLGPGGFWGHRYFTGTPPYYYSLYPGLACLALTAAAGWPRRRPERWAWAVAGLGLFFALGRFNPLLAWFFELRAFRYPVKFWLPVALGAALLVGLGFERAFVRSEPAARRRFRVALLVLALAFLSFWLVARVAPGAIDSLVASLVSGDKSPRFLLNERLRWSGLAFLSLVVLGGLGLSARLAARRPVAGGAALVTLHAVSQIFFLGSLATMDAALPYRVPPLSLEHVEREHVAAHGSFGRLFGNRNIADARFPNIRDRWLYRRAHQELLPPSGARWGRRFALNLSPEGLDSFSGRLAKAAVQTASDEERFRLLAAFGVDRLLVAKELEGWADRLVARQSIFSRGLWIYDVAPGTPNARLLGKVRRAADPETSRALILDPDFDPSTTVVVGGGGLELDGPPGEVEVLVDEAERFEARVRSEAGGVLALRRAWLPLWRATIDGEPVEPATANLYLMGLEVGPGEHEIELWVNRRPLYAATVVAVLAVLAIGGLAVSGGRSRSAAGEAAGSG